MALRYPSLELVKCVAAVREVCIPYVPGLLAFREMAVLAPALARLIRLLGRKPDLIIVDGHGIAHPRRAGIATHVGVAFDIPSIGVAKRRLYGRETQQAGMELLVAEEGPIAVILRKGRSRIYVSPGHRVGLKTSARLVGSMLKRGRLPEPTRLADKISKELRRNVEPPPQGSIRYIQCSNSSSRSILSL